MLRLLGRQSNRSSIRRSGDEVEVSEVTVDTQAIRQRLTEGLPSKAIADRI